MSLGPSQVIRRGSADQEVGGRDTPGTWAFVREGAGLEVEEEPSRERRGGQAPEPLLPIDDEEGVVLPVRLDGDLPEALRGRGEPVPLPQEQVPDVVALDEAVEELDHLLVGPHPLPLEPGEPIAPFLDSLDGALEAVELERGGAPAPVRVPGRVDVLALGRGGDNGRRRAAALHEDLPTAASSILPALSSSSRTAPMSTSTSSPAGRKIDATTIWPCTLATRTTRGPWMVTTSTAISVMP